MKTKTAILAAHGGSHEAAFDALYADYAATVSATAQLQEQLDGVGTDDNTIRTRVIAKALAPLAEALGIELPPAGQKPAKDAAQTLARQVEETLSDIGALEAGRGAALELLAEAGLDVEKLSQAEGAESEKLVQGWLEGIHGAQTKLLALERDAALTDLKLDPKKAGRVLGNVTLVKDKVLVKDEQGNAKEVETWGVKNADGTFTAAEKLIADAGWTMQELAPRTDSGLPANTGTGTQQVAGFLLNTGQASANTGTQGGLLDFLTAKPAEAAKS